MRVGALLAGFGLMVFGCGGEASSGSTRGTSHTEDTALQGASAGARSSSACIPPSIDDAGPGACTFEAALVSCTGPGGGCECLSDDPTTCAGCSATVGAVSCVSKCAANEYAAACGGPPLPGGSVKYQAVPDTCRVIFSGPGGGQFACCPCQ